ncbi:MAG: methyl-accepting chemotaxis protein, partial [Hasllibacter sp.]
MADPQLTPRPPRLDPTFVGRLDRFIGIAGGILAPTALLGAAIGDRPVVLTALLAAALIAGIVLVLVRCPVGPRRSLATICLAYAGHMLMTYGFGGTPFQIESNAGALVLLFLVVGYGNVRLLWTLPVMTLLHGVAFYPIDPAVAAGDLTAAGYALRTVAHVLIASAFVTAAMILIGRDRDRMDQLANGHARARDQADRAYEARERAETAEREMRAAMARAEEAAEEGRRIDRKASAATKAAAEERGAIIEALREGLARLADGDMTVRLAAAAGEGATPLHHEFDAAVDGLARTLSGTLVEAARTRALFDRLGEIGEALAARSSVQAEALDRVGGALDRLATTAEAHEAEARRVSEVEAGARGSADGAARVLSRTRRAMSEIETTSEGIARITGIIDHIAFQTGLLALNAGVEASRAGDAGRGFGVVATEVRQLARRAAKAARDIADLVETGEDRVADGVRLAEESGRTVTLVSSIIAPLSM